jgi:hypothetical protein
LWSLLLLLFLVAGEILLAVESGASVRILVGDLANLEDDGEEEEAGTDEVVEVIIPGSLSSFSTCSSATDDDDDTTASAAEEDGAELDSVILGKFIPGLACLLVWL